MMPPPAEESRPAPARALDPTSLRRVLLGELNRDDGLEALVHASAVLVSVRSVGLHVRPELTVADLARYFESPRAGARARGLYAVAVHYFRERHPDAPQSEISAFARILAEAATGERLDLVEDDAPACAWARIALAAAVNGARHIPPRDAPRAVVDILSAALAS
jgi:hypothetical protein